VFVHSMLLDKANGHLLIVFVLVFLDFLVHLLQLK